MRSPGPGSRRALPLPLGIRNTQDSGDAPVPGRARASRLRIQTLPPEPGVREAASATAGLGSGPRFCGAAVRTAPLPRWLDGQTHTRFHGGSGLLPPASSQRNAHFSRRWTLLRYACEVPNTHTQKPMTSKKKQNKALGQHPEPTSGSLRGSHAPRDWSLHGPQTTFQAR